MSISTLFFYILVGKLSIYLIQRFPLVEFLYKWKSLEKLFACNLCLGVWVYFFFAYIFKINFMQEFGYIPILYELLTGAITSFVVWIFEDGWKSKFGVFEVK